MFKTVTMSRLTICVDYVHNALTELLVDMLQYLLTRKPIANAKVSARQPCTSKTDFDMK